MKSSAYFYVKTKILTNFHTCVSVPLNTICVRTKKITFFCRTVHTKQVAAFLLLRTILFEEDTLVVKINCYIVIQDFYSCSLHQGFSYIWLHFWQQINSHSFRVGCQMTFIFLHSTNSAWIFHFLKMIFACCRLFI